MSIHAYISTRQIIMQEMCVNVLIPHVKIVHCVLWGNEFILLCMAVQCVSES